MPGLSRGTKTWHHVLCVKWRFHFSLHKAVVKCQARCPVLDGHCCCSVCFSGQGEVVLLSGELTLFGASCGSCPLAPVASERASDWNSPYAQSSQEGCYFNVRIFEFGASRPGCMPCFCRFPGCDCEQTTAALRISEMCVRTGDSGEQGRITACKACPDINVKWER